MTEQVEVHIFTDGSKFTVWQKGTLRIPDLTWDQACAAAELLGGKIVVHGADEDRVIDLTESAQVDERD